MHEFSHGLPQNERAGQPLDENLRIDLTPIGIDLGEQLSPILQDLIHIAASVYAADRLVSRGEVDNLYGESWRRDFSFALGVNSPDIWNHQADGIAKLLGFLTEDVYQFGFLQAHPRSPLALDYGPGREMSEADCVCLFSGGLDSLAGLAQLVSQGRKPLVVSHYSVPKRAKYIPKVLLEFQSKLGIAIPQTQARISLTGLKGKEETQRSRSFLYLSIGAAVAKALSIEDIFIFDNGVVSVNLPKARSVCGAHASRSTHPRFLVDFQSVVSRALGEIRVHNPFLWTTKGEVISMLRDNSLSDLISSCISCGNTRSSGREHSHCGVCSQCVDRRFAVSALDPLGDDPDSLYAKNIFCDALRPGIEKTHAVQHWVFAKGIREMSQDRFYEEYPEAMDVLQVLPERDAADKVYDLMVRHAEEARNGLKTQFNWHFDRYLEGSLPDTCLLKMAGEPSELVQDLSQIPELIESRLQIGLRNSFAYRRPRNERDVQNEINALLSAARLDFSREFPHLEYSLVQSIPDFSLDGSHLVLEVKFVGDRKALTSVTTHMNDQAVKYNRQGYLVCFLVWDEGRVIADDQKFAEPFLELPGVIRVAVMR